MSRARSIVACIGSDVVGALIDGSAGVWMMAWLGEEHFVDRAETDVAWQAAIIDDLDSGRIDDARRRLNVSIDGALITIGPSIRDGRRLDAVSASAIAQIQEQRRKTGYSPDDPGVATAVTSALESRVSSSTTADSP